MLKVSFRDLHNFVQFLRPGLPVLVHSYDYAVPSGKALEIPGIIKLAGPWIKNVLDEKLIGELGDQTAIVHFLVDELSEMHRQLEAEFQGLGTNTYRFVDCRRCVDPDQWANEIHPKRSGYRAVVNRFRDAIAAI